MFKNAVMACWKTLKITSKTFILKGANCLLLFSTNSLQWHCLKHVTLQCLNCI